MAEVQMIRVELDNEQIQKRGEAVARLIGEAAIREEALKDSTSEERKEIKALKNEAWGLAKEIREKARYEPSQLPLANSNRSEKFKDKVGAFLTEKGIEHERDVTIPDGHRVPYQRNAK